MTLQFLHFINIFGEEENEIIPLQAPSGTAKQLLRTDSLGTAVNWKSGLDVGFLLSSLQMYLTCGQRRPVMSKLVLSGAKSRVSPAVRTGRAAW